MTEKPNELSIPLSILFVFQYMADNLRLIDPFEKTRDLVNFHFNEMNIVPKDF